MTNVTGLNLRSQKILNSAGTVATLTIDNTAEYDFSGEIDGNSLGLVKSGAGKPTLSGANTYTGTTKVEAGTLQLGGNGAISASSNAILAGGTLDMGSFDNLLGALAVTGAATIALGDGTGRLSFADSSWVAWTDTLTLTGTLGPTTLRFGTSPNALPPSQLQRISIDGQRVFLDDQGYVARLKRYPRLLP